jgi:hypothetical protein
MQKKAKPTWDYFELLLFILGWLGLFLFLIALIFAHHIGFFTALKVSLGYWIFIVIVFAATALSMNYILVTNNEKHFSRIPSLQIENWAK